MSSPVQIGEVLAGKYEVERVLGAGGMGVVVAARHLQLDQRVALKFMLPAALADASGVERFLREARAAVRLRGEHVARVMDVGTLSEGAPYIVMEYLEGSDLGSILEKEGALSVETAADYILQACEAMAEAHAQGIVHRDLKPQNLFITHRPNGSALLKVLDFGISKLMPSVADMAVETKTSIMMGSPAYMAPEQMKSAKSVDARADVWSLGAILYQLVSLNLPFYAETMPEMFAKVLAEPPRPLREVAPHAPAGLAAVIEKCLTKERDGRYANVGELAGAIAPFASEQGQRDATSITKMIGGASSTNLPAVKRPATPQPAAAGKPTQEAHAPTMASMDTPAPKASSQAVRTTQGSAAGEVSLAGRTSPERPSVLKRGEGKGRTILIGAAIVAVAAGIAIMASVGGHRGAKQPQPAAQPAPDPTPPAPKPEPAPQPKAEPVVTPAVIAADAGVPAAVTPPPVKTPPVAPKKITPTAPPKQTTPTTQPPKQDTPPKQDPPPKKPDDDPFNTVQ